MGIQQNFFQDMAEKISSKLPSGISQCREDVEKNIKAILQTAFAKMDLVTREEFDIQAALLAKCRERIEQLEVRVKSLEVTRQ